MIEVQVFPLWSRAYIWRKGDSTTGKSWGKARKASLRSSLLLPCICWSLYDAWPATEDHSVVCKHTARTTLLPNCSVCLDTWTSRAAQWKRRWENPSKKRAHPAATLS
jgi:hypothetical protein